MLYFMAILVSDGIFKGVIMCCIFGKQLPRTIDVFKLFCEVPCASKQFLSPSVNGCHVDQLRMRSLDFKTIAMNPHHYTREDSQ